eukprot:361044-Chlamydomonas_euryale.AAC.1
MAKTSSDVAEKAPLELALLCRSTGRTEYTLAALPHRYPPPCCPAATSAAGWTGEASRTVEACWYIMRAACTSAPDLTACADKSTGRLASTQDPPTSPGPDPSPVKKPEALPFSKSTLNKKCEWKQAALDRPGQVAQGGVSVASCRTRSYKGCRRAAL